MVHVLSDIARGRDGNGEIVAPRPQQTGDALEDPIGMRLIVNGVKRGDEIETTRSSELCSILLLEPGVREPQGHCLCAPGGDALLGKVVADEPTLRERMRHEVHRMAG